MGDSSLLREALRLLPAASVVAAALYIWLTKEPISKEDLPSEGEAGEAAAQERQPERIQEQGSTAGKLTHTGGVLHHAYG